MTEQPDLPTNPYTTVEHLREACKLYDVGGPADDMTAARLLVLAAYDVERACGRQWATVMDDLDEAQRAALADAVAIQGAFRAEQGSLQLGADDNIASTGSVSFSLRPIPRMSPEAVDRLSGTGLIVRAPMANDPSADPVDAA